MALSRKEIETLAAKLMEGSIAPAEQEQLNRWLDEQMAKSRHEVESSFAADAEELRQRMLARIIKQVEPEKRIRRRSLRRLGWWAAAAITIFSLTITLWPIREPEIKLTANDIQPGGNRATLSFANGHTVRLDDAREGIVVNDNDIMYSDGNTLGLRPTDTLVLTTPQGGTYRVRLPDGSDVWLNAGSTLKYPSRFSGDVRVVYLEGEAYFDVKQQAIGGGTSRRTPFQVVSQTQTVEVLGTAFNISAYLDDPEHKTTLVTGRVAVKPHGTDRYWQISPGEQGVLINGVFKKSPVDTDQFTAWKGGYFYFDGLPPQAAFAQLGRWYDLDVVYQGKMPTVKFFGMIERNKPLGSILNILEKSGLTFEIKQVDNRNQLIVFNETET